MLPKAVVGTTIQSYILNSSFLNRKVTVDCYLPADIHSITNIDLLLINDGQDLISMNFINILDKLFIENAIVPLFCVGIHCAPDRKNEYGTAMVLDYKGRGANAALFSQFVMEELLPFLRTQYTISNFQSKSFAGFSLGGLCALDIVWNHAQEFHKAGIFSGSFWWRDKDQDDPDFDEQQHRIMHRLVREGAYKPWLNFFFEVGRQDEAADRNNNGIIDSIDDTLGLIQELKLLGYKEDDIRYLELSEGKHDIDTWALAFPEFLKWGWGKKE